LCYATKSFYIFTPNIYQGENAMGGDPLADAAGMAGTGVGLAILGMGAGVAIKSISNTMESASKPRRKKRQKSGKRKSKR
jgi:hypothetical protein